MSSSNERLDKLVEQARRERETREKGYREKALKLYPWICGRCGREFTHSNLRELTVHHRDHNHDNNPEDGSNWELLCLYCHDNEHQRQIEVEREAQAAAMRKDGQVATHSPFADLKSLLKS